MAAWRRGSGVSRTDLTDAGADLAVHVRYKIPGSTSSDAVENASSCCCM